MSIVIDDPEIERLARDLAAETGESIQEALRRVLRERSYAGSSDRVKEREESVEELAERIRRLQRDFREGLVNDERTDDQILGYDERGLPR